MVPRSPSIPGPDSPVAPDFAIGEGRRRARPPVHHIDTILTFLRDRPPPIRSQPPAAILPTLPRSTAQRLVFSNGPAGEAPPVRRASFSPSSPLLLPTVRFVRSRSATAPNIAQEEDPEEAPTAAEEEEALPVCISAVMFYPPDPRLLIPQPPASSPPVVPRRCLSGPTPARLPPPPRRYFQSVPSIHQGLSLGRLTDRQAPPEGPRAL